MQVAAVIPTYNRKDLLLECLHSVLHQTRPVDAIILVDNASTDGTSEALCQAGYAQHALLHCIRLEENVGSSGAYCTGLTYAYEQGYDWFWLMDDDAIPRADTLEHLLQHAKTDTSKNIGGFVSCPTPGSKGQCLRRLPKSVWEALSHYIVYPLDIDATSDAAVALDWSTFISLLIPRKVVGEVGLPRPEFYIDCDDVEYTLRMRRAGYSIYLIKASLIDHGLHELGRRPGRDARWRYYYRYRNHIANMIIHRDYIGKYITIAALLRITLGAMSKICMYPVIDHDYRSAKLIWQAVLNGYALKLGKYGHEKRVTFQRQGS
jgi:rhamnopyranosyl-N-acetylglucosaminyl-diphospho-decaprenol beta-1,3/1,4-galactofuranosyltransferase